MVFSISDSHATKVTYQFEGEITKVDTPLDGEFQIGDLFTGTYIFDLDTPDRNDSFDFDNFTGDRAFINTISAMTFTSNSYTVEATNGDITKLDNLAGRDDMGISFYPTLGVSIGDYVPSGMGLHWSLHARFQSLLSTINTPDPRFEPIFTLNHLNDFDVHTVVGDFFDANGILVWRHLVGVVEGNTLDFNQPLFLSNGQPHLNGYFGLSFLNASGQRAGVRGKINSVSVVSPASLIAHWPLDDGEGTIASDITGNGLDGVLVRDPAWQDNQLFFDGVDDYVEVGSGEAFGLETELTLAAWVQSDNLSNCRSRDCRILSSAKGTATQDHTFMLSTIKVGNKTRLRFRLRTNRHTSTLIASSGDLINGELFHAAAVYDGDIMRLYKDGVEVGRLVKTGRLPLFYPRTWIGGNPFAANSRPWKGTIADVRIYDKALTEDELNVIKDN